MRVPRNKLTRAAAVVVYYGLARYLPRRTRPGGEIGRRVRAACCAVLFADTGAWINVEPNVDFGNGRSVKLGNRSGIGKGSSIDGLILGDHVMIGPELLTVSTTHQYDDGEGHRWERGSEEYAAPMVGSGTWIGARVTLLPGVKIGKWCVIGAGAVVTRDVPDYAVAAGVPARVIRFWNEESSTAS